MKSDVAYICDIPVDTWANYLMGSCLDDAEHYVIKNMSEMRVFEILTTKYSDVLIDIIKTVASINYENLIKMLSKDGCISKAQCDELINAGKKILGGYDYEKDIE